MWHCTFYVRCHRVCRCFYHCCHCCHCQWQFAIAFCQNLMKFHDHDHTWAGPTKAGILRAEQFNIVNSRFFSLLHFFTFTFSLSIFHSLTLSLSLPHSLAPGFTFSPLLLFSNWLFLMLQLFLLDHLSYIFTFRSHNWLATGLDHFS